MRIQSVSDVHLEFGNAIPPLVARNLAPAKQMWLLGDAVDEWLTAELILYVLANHEFDGSDIHEARQFLAG